MALDAHISQSKECYGSRRVLVRYWEIDWGKIALDIALGKSLNAQPNTIQLP
jgi:hypothetical protein